MKTTTTIKVSTYNCELVFIVTDQIKADSRMLFKKYKIPEEDEDGENEGLLITSDIDKYFLLIDLKYLSHNTIAHEVYHGTVRITEDRGITDEEAQAWVCGHLTSAIYKFLDKKKIAIKHG